MVFNVCQQLLQHDRRENEYFVDSGFYKFHEAYHLLRFQMKADLEKAYSEYLDLKKANLWGNRKYF